MEGYTGKTGKPFSFNALKVIVTNQVYTGLMQYAGAEIPVHRPDLQIISFVQFQRVQKLVKKRSQIHDFDGKRGKYIFTGYVVCGSCGGKMVAQKQKKSGVIYTCVARFDGRCKNGKNYNEKLILPAVIEILADTINRHCGLDNALNVAANQLGKTVSEEAIEAAIRGELAVVKAGKERLINALTDGIFTQGEVSAKLEELRQKEQNLKIELISINEKAEIRDSFLKAIEALKSRDIRVTLTDMVNERPLAFRQLLGIILKPNSLKVRTYRKAGTNRHWLGEVISYELTDPVNEYVNSSFSKEIL